jgi:ribose 5-phosphate isomerase
LAHLIQEIPGVVDHGLFISIATLAIVGTSGGVKLLELAKHQPAA